MKIDRPITIALIFFAVLLLVFFLVMPEYNKFKSLETELGEKTAEFNAEYDYYQAIGVTYQKILARADDIKKVDNALPEEPDLGKLIYFLQNVATGNGMMIKNLVLSKMTPSNAQGDSSNVRDVVFSISLVGDYSSLENFMVSLENSARVFEITNISFGSSVQATFGSDQSQFQTRQTNDFNLQIKTHSY
jgi:Tfp pilus assembly protein PilO